MCLWLLCTVIIYSPSSWMVLALPLELFAIINPEQHIRTFVTHFFNPIELNNLNRPLYVSFFFLLSFSLPIKTVLPELTASQFLDRCWQNS